jgi:hypothetical protein
MLNISTTNSNEVLPYFMLCPGFITFITIILYINVLVDNKDAIGDNKCGNPYELVMCSIIPVILYCIHLYSNLFGTRKIIYILLATITFFAVDIWIIIITNKTNECKQEYKDNFSSLYYYLRVLDFMFSFVCGLIVYSFFRDIFCKRNNENRYTVVSTNVTVNTSNASNVSNTSTI